MQRAIQNLNYHNLDRDYMVKQNRKLRMQLKQSNNIKQLHQEALMQMNQKYPQSKVIPTLISIINQISNQSKIQQLNQLIMQLESKVIVLEKIVSQTQQDQKQTYNLLAEQFQKLRQQNVKKQDQLHKFYQKIGQVDYISGLVTKYKEIISTTQQAMSFKKQQQQLLDALNLQQDQIKKITEQKDKLLKINVHMKQQVQKRKDQVRNMTVMLMCDPNQQNQYVNAQNFLDDLDTQGNPGSRQNIPTNLIGPASQRSNLSMARMSKANMSVINSSLISSNPNTTLNFIKLQRQLLKDVKQQDQMNSSYTNQSDMDCPQLSILFPDKVQKIIKQKEQFKVPYLNMKKVRQMMVKRQQKMRKQWQQQKSHINPTTKIIQIQTQLQITRKQLSNQSLKYRLMKDEIKFLRLRIDELGVRNELLVESNWKLKNNYQIIYKDYQVCRSIAAEVERAMGMYVSKENQSKIREKLGQILFKNNTIKEQNTLQMTLRDQINTRMLTQVFQFNPTSKKAHQRSYSI